MKKEEFDRAKWMPYLIVGIILIVVYKAFDNVTPIGNAIGQFFTIISPLLLGILFTYFLYIPHKFLEKLLRKFKIKKFTFISTRARGISTILIFVLLIVVIALVLSFLLPVLFSSISDLARNLPGYAQTLMSGINGLLSDPIFDDLDFTSLLVTNISSLTDRLLSMEGVISQAVSGIAGFVSGLFNIILGIFLSLYILLYRDEIGAYCIRLNNAVFKSEQRKERIVRYAGQINHVLLTFIASKGVDALCNFTAATLITTIFGVPYSLLLGLMAGIFNFIPYIGSIVSSAIITLMAFLTCSVPVAVTVMVCVFAFQQLDGNFIEPRIMKSSLKVNPILVIMAVVIGGAYFGLPGMFLGVPIVVIIKQILGEYISLTEATDDEEDLDIRR